MKEKCLQFVLRYYRPGVFDTRRALRRFKGLRPVSRRRLRLWHCGVGLAASLLLCAGLYYYQRLRAGAAWTRLVAADAVATYVLPDSTRITLSPHSSLRYREAAYGPGGRDVELDGKAYFAVRHLSGQPFRVFGRRATVTVLGTQFQVDGQRADSAVEVYVAEGRVRFAARDGGASLVLTRGMQARLAAGDSLPRAVPLAAPNPAVWAVGTFVYDGTPLSAVLAELSAYYHVRLWTPDADRTLTAEFRADEGLDTILRLIERSLDVRIERR